MAGSDSCNTSGPGLNRAYPSISASLAVTQGSCIPASPVSISDITIWYCLSRERTLPPSKATNAPVPPTEPRPHCSVVDGLADASSVAPYARKCPRAGFAPTESPPSCQRSQDLHCTRKIAEVNVILISDTVRRGTWSGLIVSKRPLGQDLVGRGNRPASHGPRELSSSEYT